MPLFLLPCGKGAQTTSLPFKLRVDAPRWSSGFGASTSCATKAEGRPRARAEVLSSIDTRTLWASNYSAGPALPTAEQLEAVAANAGGDKRAALAKAYSRVVKELASHGRYPEAWKLFCMLRAYKATLSYSVYQAVISAALKADEGQRAVAAFEAITEGGLVPNRVTWCFLIGGLLKCSPLKRPELVPLAHDLWRRLAAEEAASRVEFDRSAFACGINVCCEAGDMDEASRLMGRMAIDGFQPDFRQYNMLIKGFGDRGDIAAVKNVFNTMRNRSVEPTLETFNSLVRAHCRAGDVAAAVAIIDDRKRAYAPLDERAWGCVLQVHVDRKDRAAAEDCFAQMQAAGVRPSAYTYTKLLAVYRAALTVSEAKQAAASVWRHMMEHGVAPTVPAYNAMLAITLQENAALESNAVQAVAEMRGRGLVPTVDTCNTVMAAALAQQDALVAVSVYASLQKEGLQADNVTLTTLMATVEGQAGESERIFDQMKTPDVPAYRALIALFAAARRMNDATRMLNRLRDLCRAKGCVQELMPSYSAMATAYARAYRSENAVRMLREFNSEGGVPDKMFLETVLGSCVETGKLKYAQQIVRAMQLSGIEVDVRKFQDIVDQSRARLRRQDELTPGKERTMVALERFKFWLGMPNNYYENSWR